MPRPSVIALPPTAADGALPGQILAARAANRTAGARGGSRCGETASATSTSWPFSSLAELRLAAGDLPAARAALDEAEASGAELKRRALDVAGWPIDPRRAVEAAEAGE